MPQTFNHKFLRWSLIAVCFFILSLFISRVSLAQEATVPGNNKAIQVFVDDSPLEFDVPPLIKEGRVLVPFRLLAERLHLAVAWNELNQTVTATTPATSLQLMINSHEAIVNGRAMPLDVAPEIIDGRTLLPLRFFGENLNCTVDWLAEEQIVKIKTPPQNMLVSSFYALGSSAASSWQNLFLRDFPEAEQGHGDLVRKISLGWYSLDSTGNLLTKSTTGWQRPAGWEKVLEVSAKYQIKTEMVIHMTDKDAQLSKLIADSSLINKAVAGICQEAKLYQGVNLDLEGLGWQESDAELANTRHNFTRLVTMLYQKLAAQGLTLTLTLHAPNSAYQGYDYEALGRNCDAIIIMAYDYGSQPEPNELVAAAVEGALAQVPAEKLILGISLPSENTTSLLAKIGLAKYYQLKGISLWRLGLVTPEMWQILHQEILPWADE